MIKGWRDDQKGVEIRPSDRPDEVSVYYSGLLSKSGADQVYIHCGTGDCKHWTNVNTYKMDKNWNGYEKTIKFMDETHICFKDSAANWDNNCGYNWTIK